MGKLKENSMGQYSQYLYVRTINPGTEDEYLLVGREPGEVDATNVGDSETVNPKVARYVLAGTGDIQFTAPLYVED